MSCMLVDMYRIIIYKYKYLDLDMMRILKTYLTLHDEFNAI